MELMKISMFVLCVIFMAFHAVNGCAESEWTCTNGQCIPGSWRCDVHWVDCADGSDEVNCGCAESEWTCDNGQCIPGSYRCDVHWVDCADGSDEANCGGGGYDESPFHADPAMPKDAQMVCQQSDLELTKVNSLVTLDAAMKLLQESGYTGNVWVDGQVNFEYGMVYFSDGSAQHISEIPIWHDGEPNMSGTCLHLWNDGTGHKLDDTSCDYPQAFICGEPLPEIGGQLATPDEADAICASRGQALYTVNTEHSLNRAISVLESHGIFGNAWVDGRKHVDVYRFTDNSMQWADDIKIWQDGEPNGSGECLHLWNNGWGHKLDDTTCDYPQEFLCG